MKSIVVRLGLEGNLLVLDREQFRGVVDGAVAVVVVADRAVEQVVAEDAIECLALGGRRPRRLGGRPSSPSAACRCAGADQLAVDLDHAGVAGLDGAELGVIADLRNLGAAAVDHIDQPLSWLDRLQFAINGR